MIFTLNKEVVMTLHSICDALSSPGNLGGALSNVGSYIFNMDIGGILLVLFMFAVIILLQWLGWGE